jgi:hypothetical protein
MSHPTLVTGAAGGAPGVDRRVEDRYQPTGTIRTVTGRDPHTLQEFFRLHAPAGLKLS